jgi:nitroimidazol reductase NimA-like FMN-containing flavoprotein (pyridoxamine 5'-phosphate oxidase superfamily)
MSAPNTQVTRLAEYQRTARSELDRLLDGTPVATIALIRDGHPVAYPTGFTRIGDELAIHGSTGAPWLRSLQAGATVAVSVTTLDAIMVARCGFESSFRYRSATIFGTFDTVADGDKFRYLEALTEKFIPGRVAELRPNTRKELAATIVLRLRIGAANWSLKVSDGWPQDAPDDVAAGVWAGVVPLSVVAGTPQRAPDCDTDIPVPHSVLRMGRGD